MLAKIGYWFIMRINMLRERVVLEISKMYITLLRRLLNIQKALKVFKMERRKSILIARSYTGFNLLFKII